MVLANAFKSLYSPSPSVGDLKKAASCVESYLLFYPEDKEMNANKKFYLGQEGVDPKWMEPRPEAVQYIKREKYETEMMDFIEKKFAFGVSLPIFFKCSSKMRDVFLNSFWFTNGCQLFSLYFARMTRAKIIPQRKGKVGHLIF